ncbi:glycosyl transferase [Microbacterium sp. Marseille-Q6965]|uniref:glycosyl transferase n=1 Tax=Microbacterium sp. Marseille-Q6965 TaxID=2965072 RepID=UPI0021B80C0D|nr:glycosyl transferase [Microbacterium sp. Marseille-Q6965]
MRFVWAVVSFVLAAGLIGAGIAQRTVWLGPSERTVAVDVEDGARYVLLDDDVFTALPESLEGRAGTLDISGDGAVFAAYGREHDMTAWLADQAYVRVSVADGEQAADIVATDTVAPEITPEDGQEPPTRDPAGSDLWFEEFAGDGALSQSFTFPEGGQMSVLIASDGSEPAPSEISLTWPIDNSTPMAPWLIGGGAALLLLGLILYISGIVHSRRSRGPRRKGLPVPKTEPIKVSDQIEGAHDKGVISGTPPRRAIGRKRRSLIAVPAVGLSLALMTGCTADALPEPTPTPTETVLAPENQQAPAITDPQAERIVADISATVAEADQANDASIAERRLTGMALTMRQVNYDIRSQFGDYAALPTIPASPIQILLPQAFDEWPRTALVVVSDEADASAAPTILTMTQDDPWSRYRVSYAASLEPSAQIPDLAPSYQGAALVPPASSFLAIAPENLAAAYADVLGNGEDSEFAALFEAEGDTFRTEVARVRDETAAEFTQEDVAGEIAFGQSAADTEPVALATVHNGAIVAVAVNRTERVTATDDLGVVRHGDRALEALTGETETAGSFERTDSSPLFFYVPAQGTDEKIRLLGWSSSVTAGTVE